MTDSKSYFSNVPKVTFKGTGTDDAFAYRYYDEDKVVMGKTMKEWLRPSACYWHSFCWNGFDVFGAGTFDRPWHKLEGQEMAEAKLDAAFDFFARLGLPYFAFHDVDMMAPAANMKEYTENLARILDPAEAKMEETGVKLLWGTANLFSDPRYMAGGATNPDPEVFACAAVQVRAMLDATKRLGGANYVFWGGREGYDTLLNTDLSREMDNYARMLSLAVDYKHKIGFDGPLLIEPKPHEPTKHQYDRDVATVYGFLERYDLLADVKVNIETNHATLAGLPMDHEMAAAYALGIFGSVDANRGDPQNGWDTDQFWNDGQDITRSMIHFLRNGGFTTGGFNFDAKVRRQSIDAEDLYHGHIGGMDALAKGLMSAAELIQHGEADTFLSDRYAGWDGDLGKMILADGATLDDIAAHAIDQGLDPKPRSGRQERLETLVHRFA